jgi:uncharacterized damage-inducible protein DinB
MDFQKELIAEFDRETSSTRKMLAAIPADADFAWKPNAKSMILSRLAGHIAELAGGWAISILTTDGMEFPADHKWEGYVVTSAQALLERYDKEVAEAKAALAGLALAKWDENWKFLFGGQAWIDESKYQVWRTWVVNHMIHHRAQLGVYLRLLDKPVPGTYGPSADDT